MNKLSPVLLTVSWVIVVLAVVLILVFGGHRDTLLTGLPAYYWFLYAALFAVLLHSRLTANISSRVSGLDILFYVVIAVFNLMLAFFKMLDSDLDGMLPFWLIMGACFAVSAVRSLWAIRTTHNGQRLLGRRD